MPSGRTHDRITLWSLPVVAGLTFSQTQNGNITLLVCGGFLFGGLMFGPDLDIYSRQYQRWGWLRWIWLPYRKALRHRSFWSHGPIVGTTLRLLYLSVWVGAVGLLGLAIAQWQVQLDWQATSRLVWRSLLQYSPELMALYLGLELGAMSHSLSDWLGSAYKRRKKPRKRKTRQSSAQPQSERQSQSQLRSPDAARSPKVKAPELPVLPPLPGSIDAQPGIDPMNRNFRD